jgi:hypothetical protein
MVQHIGVYGTKQDFETINLAWIDLAGSGRTEFGLIAGMYPPSSPGEFTFVPV